MDQTHIILTILAVLAVAIIIFALIKGIIKMVLLAIAVSSAVAAWIVIQKNGFTYVAFVTDSPQQWMVQALAWSAAILILLIFFHGMVWISQLFSFKKKFGLGGVLTTIFMSLIMIWVTIMGICYYGNVCRIRYYHELAAAQMQLLKEPATQMPTTPWFTRMSTALRKSKATGWIQSIDPIDDPAQTNLACLVAFGCTLDEPTFTTFYNTQLANRGIPQPTRLLDLFRDPGLRTMVKEGRFVSLLENERLNTVLRFRNTADTMRNIL
jgi:hypothetical protein